MAAPRETEIPESVFRRDYGGKALADQKRARLQTSVRRQFRNVAFYHLILPLLAGLAILAAAIIGIKGS
jgi:hypothetical protein